MRYTDNRNKSPVLSQVRSVMKNYIRYISAGLCALCLPLLWQGIDIGKSIHKTTAYVFLFLIIIHLLTQYNWLRLLRVPEARAKNMIRILFWGSLALSLAFVLGAAFFPKSVITVFGIPKSVVKAQLILWHQYAAYIFISIGALHGLSHIFQYSKRLKK